MSSTHTCNYYKKISNYSVLACQVPGLENQEWQVKEFS